MFKTVMKKLKSYKLDIDLKGTERAIRLLERIDLDTQRALLKAKVKYREDFV